MAANLSVDICKFSINVIVGSQVMVRIFANETLLFRI